MTLRSGGLFAGYGGLDLAVAEIFGSEPAWFSEIDDSPSKILAHHWPTVPNHGDIAQIDWDQVEPVDILSGGFPCQDVSLAGKRAGMTADTRSGLWAHFAIGISKLRPRYVVIENVRGLLSAEAHSDVEPCSWCLGDGPGEPALRALGAVLGDLADLGYDAQWCGLRAADVGAPHGRYRIFILARNTEVRGRDGARLADRGGQPTRPARGSGIAASDADHGAKHGQRPRTESRVGGPPSADTGSDGRQRRAESDQWSEGGLAAPLGHDPDRRDHASAHAVGDELAREREQQSRGTAATRGGDELIADADRDPLREQPVTESRRSGSPVAGLAGDPAPHSEGNGRHEGRPESAGKLGGPDASERGTSAAAWGQYGAAIERWERTLGRVAPAPTEPNSKGSQRLNPAFVEWMMGLPAGHVTAVAGVNRNAQLKALGNGVVPQQAIAALRHMHATHQLLATA